MTILGAANEKNTQKSPYILISLENNVKPTKIQLLGVGNGAMKMNPGELILAFSQTGTADNDFKTDPNEWPLAFEVDQNNNLSQDVPVGTKHILLIAKDGFDGQSISFISAVDIHAIRLFTDKTVVGIDEQANEQLGLKINDRIISCLEPAIIDVYSIAGIRVRSEQHITEINLSDLNAGAYIVKAKSPQTGKEELLKVLVR